MASRGTHKLNFDEEMKLFDEELKLYCIDPFKDELYLALWRKERFLKSVISESLSQYEEAHYLSNGTESGDEKRIFARYRALLSERVYYKLKKYHRKLTLLKNLLESTLKQLEKITSPRHAVIETLYPKKKLRETLNRVVRALEANARVIEHCMNDRSLDEVLRTSPKDRAFFKNYECSFEGFLRPLPASLNE
jgi:tetratricopeptide (TPR) repeat protein